MADQQVEILIHVQQAGADAISDIDNRIKKLDMSQKDTGNDLDKTSKSFKGLDDLIKKDLIGDTGKLTDSLNKQFPALKALSPVMGELGLAGMGAASAFVAFVMISMQMGQNLLSLQGDIAMLGVTAGISGVNGMDSYKASQQEVVKESDLLGISQKAAADAMAPLLAVTRDMGQAETLLQEAVEAHRASGKPLNDIVKDYGDILSGNKVIIDDTTGKQLVGADAVAYYTKQLKEQGTSSMNTAMVMRDAAGQASGFWVTALGGIGQALWITIEAIWVGFTWLFTTAIPWAIAQPINYIMGVFDWFKDAWFTVLDYYNKGWSGLWQGIKDISRNAAQWVADHTINPLIALLNSVLSLWNLIPGVPHTIIPSVTIPAFAQGGITPGGPILVGENGPEILSPPGGSRVTPNGALGGGSTTIQLVLPDGTMLGQWLWNQMDNQVRLRGAS